ncbi:MAG: RNA polymerase sigma factor [Verrucomicrobiota bacterium]
MSGQELNGDFELVQKALAGDEVAAGEIRSAARTAQLERILVSRGGSASEARDVVADLWADCFGSSGGKALLAKFNGKGSLEAFLTRVAVNRLIDFKRHQRFQTAPPGGEEGGGMDDLPSGDEEHEDLGEDGLVEVLRGALTRAFESSDPETLVMLQLVGVHGINQERVAEAWGWSQSKVSRQLGALTSELRDKTLEEVKQMDPWLEIQWEDFISLCRSCSDFLIIEGEKG